MIEDIFETINTNDKAYWLGFIYADGCVYKNRLTIGLNKKDINHLYKFCDFIQYDRDKVKIIKSGLSIVYIISKKLISDLYKYGIVPRKSYINLQPPNIDKRFECSFWRGVLDGDGWLTKNEMGICGSEKTCVGFMNYVKNLIDTKETVRINGKNSTNKKFKIGGSKNIKLIANSLYGDALIYLDRKYNTYLSLPTLKYKKQIVKRVKDKLTDSEIRYIRELSSRGAKQRDIAKIFKVSESHISRIVNNNRRVNIL